MSGPSGSNLKKKYGFSFLEMIISIGIFVLVATATSVVFNQAIHAYRYSNSRMIAVKEASLAMDWILRDIRPNPSSGNSSAITAYSADAINGDITLQPPSAGSIRYYRQSASGTIQRSEASVDSLLAKNVTQLSFTCYDADNQVIASPVGNNNVRAVEINIITQKNNQRFHLNSVAQYNP